MVILTFHVNEVILILRQFGKLSADYLIMNSLKNFLRIRYKRIANYGYNKDFSLVS